MKLLGRGGRRHAFLVPDEQRGAELGLEMADRGRDRRLRHEAGPCGGSQIAFAVDGGEIAELADFHRIYLEIVSIFDILPMTRAMTRTAAQGQARVIHEILFSLLW